ncbi:MAG: hypothetical protein H6867_08265 [Rhodospirillales bacterium]|nr:hypothetical protein [Rhodospirillales bacterium]MCB9995551.1 hypothetical protein [Rhodospirillales bacterium]
MTIETQEKTKAPFNQASAAQAATTGQMAFIIDLGFNAMDRDDAKAYLDKLADTVQTMRDQNIPITWVAMSDKNKLHPAEDSAPSRTLSISELEERGYFGPYPENGPNDDLFHEFLEQHGPRTDDAIYLKFFKSALMTPEDYADNPALEQIVRADYRTDIEFDLPKPGSFEGPSMAEYMQQKGLDKPIIMGAVSTNCDLCTALSSVAKGMQPTILTDMVLSWDCPEEEVNPQTSKLLWQDNVDTAFHADKMKARLAQIIHDDRQAWGLPEDTIEKITFGVSDDLSHQGHGHTPGSPATKIVL